MEAAAYDRFLAMLPADRSAAAAAVWQHIRQHMADGYTEQLDGKFLTFKAQTDWYVALANQKNYLSLYLMPLYVYPDLKTLFEASDKKPKMGKSCINFLQIDELPMDAIGLIVGTYPADDYLKATKQLHQNHHTE